MADLFGVALAGVFGIGFVCGMWVVLFRRELAPLERSRAVYGHAYEEILPKSRLKKVRSMQPPSESEKIETLYNSASKNIELDNNNFELSLNQIHQINFKILWRQDEFIIRKFKEFENSPHLFLDQENYRKLIAEGNEMIFKENIMNLRKILNSLWGLVIYDDDENRLDDANILRG